MSDEVTMKAERLLDDKSASDDDLREAIQDLLQYVEDIEREAEKESERCEDLETEVDDLKEQIEGQDGAIAALKDHDSHCWHCQRAGGVLARCSRGIDLLSELCIEGNAIFTE